MLDMKPNIIVTYFKPFGGRNENNSQILTSKLPYSKHEIDVAWNLVESQIDEILKEKPDYLILTGEALSYQELTFETLAHNISNGKDYCDVTKTDEPIIEGEDECLETKIVFDSKYHHGFNAGKYLCNYTYYLSLYKTKDTNTKVIFVHVPKFDHNEQELFEQLFDFIKELK